MSRLLVFALVGRRRQIETIDGVDPPRAPLWEIVAYPSRMGAFGDTWDKARESIVTMVYQAMDYEGSPEGWFETQFNKMGREQLALYQETVGECAGKPDGIQLSPELAQVAFAISKEREPVPETA